MDLHEKLSIKNWDPADCPSEKLKQYGASYLSNSELFAESVADRQKKTPYNSCNVF